MANFRIIPVIDILNSMAVHAIKGERDKYKPLKSKILNSSDPLEIIKILNHKFQFNEVYIADLDAIIKKNPNHNLLLKILEIPGLNVMLDPGITHKNEILIYSKYNLSKLILGLETIKNFEVIEEGLRVMGNNRLSISVDMYQGKIISNLKELKNQDPLKLVKILNKLKIKEIILLDLFRVGQKIGGIPPLFMRFRNQFQGNLLIGGGVKEFNDLEMMQKNNFSGVLIATALYDGSLNIDDLKKFI
ncbi:MAG: HisA/HisF-related TIM barrel protein [Promethearchaeota archaeon]